MATTTLPTKDPGPFSAIFNYEDEAKREEARKKQLQESQQKIIRTNAIGDALRLLVDGVGGSLGATITPKAVNPGILKAVDRYHTLDKESEGNLQRLRLTDLALKEKDIQAGLGIDAEERAATREDSRYQRGKQDLLDKELRDNEKQKDLINLQKDKQKEIDTHQTNENIRQAAEILKKQQEITGLSTGVRADRSKPLKKDDILFQIPGTTQKIYIGNEEAGEMAHMLINEMKDAGEYIMNPTLKAFERNEPVKMTSLIEVLKQNWNKVRYALPEYADQKPAEPTPQEKRKIEYDTKLEKINSDQSLRARQRVKQITQLNEDYKDLFIAPQNTIVTPDDQGVTDVSSIFN